MGVGKKSATLLFRLPPAHAARGENHVSMLRFGGNSSDLAFMVVK
jgi:hypothetical protein